MSDIFDISVKFDQLGLRDPVLRGATRAGFEYPTLIQSRLIPEVIAGRDVIGQARTGTGKTAAFALPAMHQITDLDMPMQALVLVPTRELAAQVASEFDALGHFTDVRAACIIGGESMQQQIDAIEQGCHVIVGTPGRVMDMHGRRLIHFKNTRLAVLDEIDRMLDIGFRDDIRKIFGLIKTKPQTVFVSATIGSEIESLARKFMKDAKKITAVTSSLTASLVDQKYLSVEPWDKPMLLLHLLKHEEPDTTVVFCRTKATVHKITQYLRKKNINAQAIHGDLAQKKRTKVMHRMRSGKLDVLIASDLAARGLDIDHISHVINYDLPDDPELYIHRIGRTARAGRGGTAWAFVCPDQGQLLTEIEKLAGTLIEKMDYPDFTPGTPPPDVQQERARQKKRQESPTATLTGRTKPAIADEVDPEELHRMFPGGIVPKTLPTRTLGARFRTRRGR